MIILKMLNEAFKNIQSHVCIIWFSKEFALRGQKFIISNLPALQGYINLQIKYDLIRNQGKA